jgi:hypothetical protein
VDDLELMSAVSTDEPFFICSAPVKRRPPVAAVSIQDVRDQVRRDLSPLMRNRRSIGLRLRTCAPVRADAQQSAADIGITLPALVLGEV